MRRIQLPGSFPISVVAMLVSAAAFLELGVSARSPSDFNWLLLGVGALLLALSPLDVYWRIRAGQLGGVGNRSDVRRVSVSLFALSILAASALALIVILGYGLPTLLSGIVLASVLAVAQSLVYSVASLPQRPRTVTSAG